MIPRLLGSEFSKAHHLCDQGMVLRHLVKRAICCQIQPAVSYVCNVGIVADNRSYYHRRTHACGLIICMIFRGKEKQTTIRVSR